MASRRFRPSAALALLAVASLGLSSCRAKPHEPERPPAILEFAVEPNPGEDVSIRRYELDDSIVELGPVRSYRIVGATVASDAKGYPALGFQVSGEERADFRRWTSDHVGRRLGIFLDGRLVFAPKISSAMPGTGILAFERPTRTEESVRALADRILAANQVPAVPAVPEVPQPAPAILEFAVEPAPGEDVPVTRYEFNGASLELGPKRAVRIVAARPTADDLGYPALEFEIASDQAEEFRSWTAAHLGRQLAIFVDGRIVTAPVLASALPGAGLLSFGANPWTEEQVRDLAKRLVPSPSR